MNNQSPLVPQGSMLEQKNKSRARVRLAVFFVLSIHVIGLMALLMQGCRRSSEAELPPIDTNSFAATQPLTNNPVMDTNAAVAAAAVATSNVVVAPTPSASAQTYTVVAGDTFTTIARKFPGVTTKAMMDANATIEATKLRPGMVLHVPTPAAPPATATAMADPAPTSAANTEGEQMYTVQSGDTLTKIAGRFKTSVRSLRSANPTLASDRIVVGQKLKIPGHTATPPPGATATSNVSRSTT